MSNVLHAVHDSYALLDKLGDNWSQLDALIDFEAFREVLEEQWRPEVDPAKGGRPPWDAVLMFKILLIGQKTGLSDEQLEYDLADSLSLRRFVQLDLGQAVPDRTTIARYRSALDESTMRDLFDTLTAQLTVAGFEAKDGQMIDSSFVLVPIQRNSRDENQDIKEGRIPYLDSPPASAS